MYIYIRIIISISYREIIVKAIVSILRGTYAHREAYVKIKL